MASCTAARHRRMPAAMSRRGERRIVERVREKVRDSKKREIDSRMEKKRD